MLSKLHEPARRLRLIPEQIKDLKSELPPKDSEGNQPSSPALEAQITDLETVCPFSLPAPVPQSIHSSLQG